MPDGTCVDTIGATCLGMGGNPNPGAQCSSIFCNPHDFDQCDFDTGLVTGDQATSGLRAQYAPDVHFWQEIADQFVLKGTSLENPCSIETISYLTFHTNWNGSCQPGGGPNCLDNPFDYQDLIVTISSDEEGDGKGPTCLPDCDGGGCTPGPNNHYHTGPGCDYSLAMGVASGSPPPSGNYWTFTTLGGGQPVYHIELHFDPPLDLEKNKKYWLAISAVLPETDFYHVIWFLSTNFNGNPLQFYHIQNGEFTLLGVPNDLLFSITGVKQIVDCGSCRLFGDVSPQFCILDIDDIITVLDAYIGAIHCPECDLFPCEGDGCIDLWDLIAELQAFLLMPPCPDPCPPGACILPGGECRDQFYYPGGMSETDCFILGGTYCGDFTICGVDCPGPLAAEIPNDIAATARPGELNGEGEKALGTGSTFDVIPVPWPTPEAVTAVQPVSFLYQTTSTTYDGNELVTVEIFIVNNGASDISVRGIQIDVPCSLDPGPGASGAITTGLADSDPATVIAVNATSIGGIPRVFPGGLAITNQTHCRAAQLAAVLAPPINLVPDGQLRYVATVIYRVSACAAGEFSMDMECDCPGAGLSCTPPSTTGDQTKIVGDPMTTLVPFKPASLTISVPTGSCCNGTTCLADGLNPFCCGQTHPGATAGPPGSLCGQPNACGQCVTDLDCPQPESPCQCAVCENQQCTYYNNNYGDTTCDGDCSGVDVGDLLCVLDGFSFGLLTCPSGDIYPCPFPLVPDGKIDIGDILAVLEAFIGEAKCFCYLCTGACCLPGDVCGLRPVEANTCQAVGGDPQGSGTCCIDELCSIIDCSVNLPLCLPATCP
jgi:hypothetical protein